MAKTKKVIINGAFCKQIRAKLGLNQSDFWAPLGVTQSGGSRYESGRTIPAPARKLIHLIHVIGIDGDLESAIAAA